MRLEPIPFIHRGARPGPRLHVFLLPASDQVIVPSLNPDGQIMVTQWYRKYLTEGTFKLLFNAIQWAGME